MATTQIFANYRAFILREDKTVNGISQDFANRNQNWQADNESNTACWNCSRCSDCSGCSRCSRCSGCSRCSRCSRCSGCSGCSDCSGCSRCSDCSDCSGCSGCSRCSGCSDCSGCSRCSGCSDCSDLVDAKPVQQEQTYGVPTYPVIPNIHQQVYEAACGPKALNMSTWHTCDTTHCRAGWVEYLAGEAGANLARNTSILFAAMMIYKASSPIRVAPTRFFETNEQALADMKRCADEEALLNTQTV